MSNRCPDCGKFGSLTFEDPEVDSLDFAALTVSATVTINRSFECCGSEAKTATLEMEEELDPALFVGHIGENAEPLEGHDLEIEENSIDQIEEGGGRYAKSYFGASVGYTIRCSCQASAAAPLYDGALSDKVAASEMDDCT